MKFLLVVMFYVNGPEAPPLFVDGFLPISFETYQECEERRKFAKEQLEMMGTPPFNLACYKEQKKGSNL